MDRSQHCARPGCGAPASARLTFDYPLRTAWIDVLDSRTNEGGWAICAAHADGLRVPVGWAADDRRRAAVGVVSGDPGVPDRAVHAVA